MHGFSSSTQTEISREKQLVNLIYNMNCNHSESTVAYFLIYKTSCNHSEATPADFPTTPTALIQMQHLLIFSSTPTAIIQMQHLLIFSSTTLTAIIQMQHLLIFSTTTPTAIIQMQHLLIFSSTTPTAIIQMQHLLIFSSTSPTVIIQKATLAQFHTYSTNCNHSREVTHVNILEIPAALIKKRFWQPQLGETTLVYIYNTNCNHILIPTLHCNHSRKATLFVYIVSTTPTAIKGKFGNNPGLHHSTPTTIIQGKQLVLVFISTMATAITE